jgi:hypothetical protein
MSGSELIVGGVVALITSGIGFIVWLIRLEGKVKSMEEIFKMQVENVNESFKKVNSGIIDLQVRHEKLENKIFDKLSEIEKSLARIQGRLDSNQGTK